MICSRPQRTATRVRIDTGTIRPKVLGFTTAQVCSYYILSIVTRFLGSLKRKLDLIRHTFVIGCDILTNYSLDQLKLELTRAQDPNKQGEKTLKINKINLR